MSYEQYGDYTEFEDDIPKKKSTVLLILKILIYVVCFAVVGVLVFRIILFNYYPDSMEDPYFTPELNAYYESAGGEAVIKTQDLRTPYDDPNVASFFCDNLFVIDEIGELQVSLRYNVSVIDTMYSRLGLSDLDADDPELISFRLCDNDGNIYEPPVYVGEDSFMMYRFRKLVFNGIDLKNDPPEWIRLEVFVKGQTDTEPYAMIPIYENNVDYSLFEDYEIH